MSLVEVLTPPVACVSMVVIEGFTLDIGISVSDIVSSRPKTLRTSKELPCMTS